MSSECQLGSKTHHLLDLAGYQVHLSPQATHFLFLWEQSRISTRPKCRDRHQHPMSHHDPTRLGVSAAQPAGGGNAGAAKMQSQRFFNYSISRRFATKPNSGNPILKHVQQEIATPEYGIFRQPSAQVLLGTEQWSQPIL